MWSNIYLFSDFEDDVVHMFYPFGPNELQRYHLQAPVLIFHHTRHI